jgi:hypothetical protein
MVRRDGTRHSPCMRSPNGPVEPVARFRGRLSAAGSSGGRQSPIDRRIVVRSEAISYQASLVRLRGDSYRVERSLSVRGGLPSHEPRVDRQLESVTISTHASPSRGSEQWQRARIHEAGAMDAIGTEHAGLISSDTEPTAAEGPKLWTSLLDSDQTWRSSWSTVVTRTYMAAQFAAHH